MEKCHLSGVPKNEGLLAHSPATNGRSSPEFPAVDHEGGATSILSHESRETGIMRLKHV